MTISLANIPDEQRTTHKFLVLIRFCHPYTSNFSGKQTVRLIYGNARKNP